GPGKAARAGAGVASERSAASTMTARTSTMAPLPRRGPDRTPVMNVRGAGPLRAWSSYGRRMIRLSPTVHAVRSTTVIEYRVWKPLCAGLGTTVQLDPFQCSVRGVRREPYPTAHAEVGERLTTPLSWGMLESMGTTDHEDPSY